MNFVLLYNFLMLVYKDGFKICAVTSLKFENIREVIQYKTIVLVCKPALIKSCLKFHHLLQIELKFRSKLTLHFHISSRSRYFNERSLCFDRTFRISKYFHNFVRLHLNERLRTKHFSAR